MRFQLFDKSHSCPQKLIQQKKRPNIFYAVTGIPVKVIANAAKTATPVLKKYRKIYTTTFLALIIRRRWTSDVLNVHFQEKYVVYQSSHVTGSPYKYRFVSVQVWLPLVVWVSVSGLVTGEGIKKKKRTTCPASGCNIFVVIFIFWVGGWKQSGQPNEAPYFI